MNDSQPVLIKIREALLNGNALVAKELSIQAIAEWPADINAQFLHGVACLQCGDMANAIAALTLVARAAPQMAIVHKFLADAYRNCGMLHEAEKHYRLVISLDPNSLAEQLNLIAVLATGNRINEALSQIDEVNRLSGQFRLKNLLLNRLIHRYDPLIFDVGANAGSVSQHFLAMFPSATIHAFEPAPNMFKILKENLGLVSNVVLNQYALADTCGRSSFYINNDEGTNSFLNFDSTSRYLVDGKLRHEIVEVETLTVDAYCHDKNIKHIHFMKLDVQGFEPQVLDGAVGMLSQKAIDIIQTEIIFRNYYDKPSSFFEIERRLHPYGYRLRTIFDIYPCQGEQLFQLDAVYTCLPESI